jgi:sulfite reductase (NADPH) hemoprotein beta-component
MYAYSAVDQRIIEERVTQFRDQTARYLRGELSESQFLPLRLQNGLYRQRLAPMLRIAVPYGLLSSKQLRAIARISRDYDKGYAHVSTRQNLQLNWPRLEDVPDLLADLAAVQMHAIQTSGNCIRNTTTDPVCRRRRRRGHGPPPLVRADPPVVHAAPGVRLPAAQVQDRVSASAEDRAATHFHDVGVHLYRNGDGDLRLRFLVGGGLGRTPMIARTCATTSSRGTCSPISRPSCACTTCAAPRQQVQGAHQDPRQGDGHRGLSGRRGRRVGDPPRWPAGADRPRY